MGRQGQVLTDVVTGRVSRIGRFTPGKVRASRAKLGARSAGHGAGCWVARARWVVIRHLEKSPPARHPDDPQSHGSLEHRDSLGAFSAEDAVTGSGSPPGTGAPRL